MITKSIKKIIPDSYKEYVVNNFSVKPNQNFLQNSIDLIFSPFKRMNFSSKLDSMIKEGLIFENDAYKSFNSIEDELWFYLISNEEKKLESVIPQMPPENIQLQFTGVSGMKTLTQAFLFYEKVKEIAKGNGINFNDDTRILDFGCGWGRLLRFFTKEVPNANLFGSDVDNEVLEICQSLNFKCNFILNDAFPPTKLEENYFDVIYAYSVYSHLSEEAHLKWLHEFKRILKPDGILIVTTRDREFIISCEEMRQHPNPPFYAKGLVNCFKDLNKSLKDYDEGKFLFEPVGGGGIREETFYGETCIPELYVKNEWTKIFNKVDYIFCHEHKRFDQNIIIAIK